MNLHFNSAVAVHVQNKYHSRWIFNLFTWLVCGFLGVFFFSCLFQYFIWSMEQYSLDWSNVSAKNVSAFFTLAIKNWANIIILLSA